MFLSIFFKLYLMKKLIFLLLIAVTFESVACTCIQRDESLKKKINREFKSAVGIFYGKVIRIKDYKSNNTYVSSSDVIAYTFEVTKIYKGAITKREITIKSNRGSEGCGFNFKLNNNYLVYTSYYGIDDENVSKNDLFTSICHRTKLLKKVKKKELRILKRLSKKEVS